MITKAGLASCCAIEPARPNGQVFKAAASNSDAPTRNRAKRLFIPIILRVFVPFETSSLKRAEKREESIGPIDLSDDGLGRSEARQPVRFPLPRTSADGDTYNVIRRECLLMRVKRISASGLNDVEFDSLQKFTRCRRKQTT